MGERRVPNWTEREILDQLDQEEAALMGGSFGDVLAVLSDGKWHSNAEILAAGIADRSARRQLARLIADERVERSTYVFGGHLRFAYRLKPSSDSPKVSGGKRPLSRQPTREGLASHPEMPGKCCGRPVRKSR
jgi:hypothetical protein